MDDDRPTQAVYTNYTHARRHPIMIGNIQGLRIPPVTPAQLGIAVGGLVVLAATRVVWAHFGGALNAMILVGVPLGLAWAARAVRMEGRAPWRAGLGFLQLYLSPRDGQRLGRSDRIAGPVRYRARSWIVDLEPAETQR